MTTTLPPGTARLPKQHPPRFVGERVEVLSHGLDEDFEKVVRRWPGIVTSPTDIHGYCMVQANADRPTRVKAVHAVPLPVGVAGVRW